MPALITPRLGFQSPILPEFVLSRPLAHFLIKILPFVGLVLSMAIFPLLAPRWWARRYGWVALACGTTTVITRIACDGPQAAAAAVVEALVLRYLPLILLLFALYSVAGGIHLGGSFTGTPNINLLILTIGTALASVLGTTGAVMMLIRPMIHANQHRKRHTHVFVFFIFLVGNLGGGLTPLGDPPLFVGFSRGVGFLWTMQNMALPVITSVAYLLITFTVVDRWFWRREKLKATVPYLQIRGSQNALFIPVIIGAVLLGGVWQPTQPPLHIGPNVWLPLEDLTRNGVLLGTALISNLVTSRDVRHANAFSWAPLREVAALFAAIFVTVTPAVDVLQDAKHGPMRWLTKVLTSSAGDPIPSAYFWLSGTFSSLLDNAPTYLIFFGLAGGNAANLMDDHGGQVLVAISCGAVFFGALTYLGNAPNLLTKSICDEHGIRMPGFLGYMMWSAVLLLPLFAALTWTFFR